MTNTFPNSTFSKKSSDDKGCQISKSVGHVCDHGFDCLKYFYVYCLSLISTDYSECAAMFSFHSVSKVLCKPKNTGDENVSPEVFVVFQPDTWSPWFSVKSSVDSLLNNSKRLLFNLIGVSGQIQGKSESF